MNGPEVREGLGLTSERSEELIKITRSIMCQTSLQDGGGITSHTLLTILGRKDLSDLEKVFCTYMFCRMTRIYAGQSIQDRYADMPPIISSDMHNVIDININDLGIDSSGMMITPQGVDPRELASVIIAMLVALLEQLPKEDAKDFCRGASISFIRMAMTGDMRL